MTSTPADPAVVLVSAMLNKNGTADLRSWYYAPTGRVADASIPGNYSVRVLDFGEHVLAEVTLPVTFKLNVEPVGIQDTDTQPLMVAVPYGDTAATIKITRDGVVLSRVSGSTKLLQDAINAIPDFGFVRNPSQDRKALLNIVDAIDNMLGVGDNTGVQKMLQYGLRGTVDSWLVNDYVKSEPLQLEKNEVLALIDALIERIGNFQK